MRIARALAIKSALTLGIAGTILSGSAMAVQSVTATVNSVPIVAAASHGAAPDMMSYG